ncbi:hypothetical protein SAMN04488012_102365 [Palleronia salina]|uniref:Uncharacterized protein n=1 Tax=Palleronia salina TaxID=313368 RepID=A0A1M6DF91_9RHOB|nr:hypothetical protein [Palleronia salina]SHI71749.1 hypothetical protein SAMN04488012_102365 [Palleronia salina]
MFRLVTATILALAAPFATQAQHADHSAGMTHGAAPATLTEPGQGAFAALSEVVQLLESDPHTDWSRVDLDGLRAHLVDMDLLATRAQVETDAIDGGLTARATGDARVLAALRRMVPAHAKQLAADPSWTVAVEARDDHVVLTVTADDAATTARIRGLGFFGLMASQDHHRAHHLAIARGEMPH